MLSATLGRSSVSIFTDSFQLSTCTIAGLLHGFNGLMTFRLEAFGSSNLGSQNISMEHLGAGFEKDLNRYGFTDDTLMGFFGTTRNGSLELKMTIVIQDSPPVYLVKGMEGKMGFFSETISFVFVSGDDELYRQVEIAARVFVADIARNAFVELPLSEILCFGSGTVGSSGINAEQGQWKLGHGIFDENQADWDPLCLGHITREYIILATNKIFLREGGEDAYAITNAK